MSDSAPPRWFWFAAAGVVALIVAFALRVALQRTIPEVAVPDGSTPAREEQAATVSLARPSSGSPDLEVVNRRSPGRSFDVEDHLAAGKTTVVEFTSHRCPACVEMDSVLRTLAANRPDIAVRQVDIDRPSARGIDFDSPLARRYHVDSTPAFRVYDADGNLIAQRDRAWTLVRQLYSDMQIDDGVDALPGVADDYVER